MHDFEPGIAASGLFWTIRVAPSSVDVQQKRGTARFRTTNLAISDYHDFGNAVSSLPPGPAPPSTPSVVSFDVVWHGGGDTTSIRDDDYRFAGAFTTGEATIAFRARNLGSSVEYRSDPNGQSTAGPPGVGRERNGVFFS